MYCAVGKCPKCGQITDNLEGKSKEIKGDIYFGGIICDKDEDGCGFEGDTYIIASFFDTREADNNDYLENWFQRIAGTSLSKLERKKFKDFFSNNKEVEF